MSASAVAKGREVTFVLTSCGRFDLLAETLASFAKFNAYPISRYLVTEDSGDDSVHEVVAASGLPIEVLFNQPRLGQIRSIDRAYDMVETPYIFHCEDDWRFLRGGFIEDSLEVLEREPDVSMVSVRRRGQQGGADRMFWGERKWAAGVAYHVQPDFTSRFYRGLSFNPGLRRTCDMRRFGPFAEMGEEREISDRFQAIGMSMSVLAEAACETTGADRRLDKKPVRRVPTSIRLRSDYRYFKSILKNYSKRRAMKRAERKRRS